MDWLEPPKVFRAIFIAAFVINFLNVAIYRRRAQKGQKFGWEKEGRAVAIPLRLSGLAALAYILAYMIRPAWVGWSLFEPPHWLRWSGAVFAVLLMPLLVSWAQRHLGNNVTTTVVTRENHQLVTTGPYRFIRHPLYTFGVAGYVALGLLSGSWVLIAGAALAIVLVSIRLPKEEAELSRRFGAAYDTYRSRTGRYLPRVGVRERRA